MTIAPELAGGDALVDAVVASGAVAAIGHTDATYEQAMHAIERGVTHATHCFNAMRPFSHRDPGVLGAVMTSDEVTAELIGDGAHVDFAAARVLIRAKGAHNVVLITDGMPLAGTPDGAGEWEGQAIRVEGGKAVRVSDNTIIGGVITLDQCVRNAVAHMEVALHDAIAMASTNPARAMHLDDTGVLAARPRRRLRPDRRRPARHRDVGRRRARFRRESLVSQRRCPGGDAGIGERVVVREVRLHVEYGRPVDRVQTFDSEDVAAALEQAHDGHADRVRAHLAARREHALLGDAIVVAETDPLALLATPALCRRRRRR